MCGYAQILIVAAMDGEVSTGTVYKVVSYSGTVTAARAGLPNLKMEVGRRMSGGDMHQVQFPMTASYHFFPIMSPILSSSTSPMKSSNPVWLQLAEQRVYHRSTHTYYDRQCMGPRPVPLQKDPRFLSALENKSFLPY